MCIKSVFLYISELFGIEITPYQYNRDFKFSTEITPCQYNRISNQSDQHYFDGLGYNFLD